jgi:hypothetical protein
MSSTSVAIEHWRAFVRIPRQSGHPFHGNPDTDSIGIRTPIPREPGHLLSR